MVRPKYIGLFNDLGFFTRPLGSSGTGVTTGL